MFDWFKVFNLTEFEATGLPSRTYQLPLESYGVKTILVTKGNYVSVLFDQVFLSVDMNSKNPFVFESRAVYRNPVTNDVYVGIKVEN